MRNGREFEEFVARKLQSQGFDVDLTKRTNDKGIDVIAQKGRYTYAVQAKHYSEENKVGSVAVQKASGLPARSDIDGAMIVISSSFTSEAEQVAANRGVKLVSVNLATPGKEAVRKRFLQAETRDECISQIMMIMLMIPAFNGTRRKRIFFQPNRYKKFGLYLRLR